MSEISRLQTSHCLIVNECELHYCYCDCNECELDSSYFQTASFCHQLFSLHVINFVDYLKQVLSMSRLGAAGAVAQLVADVPLSSIEVYCIWKNHNSEYLHCKVMRNVLLNNLISI